MKRLLLTFLALALLVPATLTAPGTINNAWAQDDDEEEGTSSLEEGPPVRRLLLLRSGRFEVQPAVAFSINDPFVRNIGFGAQLAYYFTNSLGIGASYFFAPVHLDTDETSAVQDPDFSPRVKETLTVNQLQMMFDVGIIWAPIAGKFSLFGLILNYDFHLFGGAGALILEARCADEGYDLCSPDDIGGLKFAGAIGFGTRIFFNNWIALNLEFRDYLTSFAEYSRGDDQAEFRQFFSGTVGVSFFLPLDVYISR